MKNSSFQISVVICTYNRDKFIGEALDSLSKQTLNPTLFEIIIVNNNCTDNTEAICKDFIVQHPELEINYVVETNQGLSFARNRGITESKYEVITYIDDDAFAKANFLELIYDYFNAHPDIAGIGGKVIPRYEIEEPKWMNKYLYGIVTKIDYGNSIRKFSGNNFPVGCNMTYRKDLLQKVGGFNNKLKWRADDKYINFKIREISDEIIYIPNLEVEHTIDAYRTSDKNFKDITLKFGSAESIRVRDEGKWSYLKKLFEFMYKLGGSFILLIMFYLKGEFAKGNYTFWYRWIATIGFLFPRKN
jgi:glucosyl-dolichyl phosphate glucuronosyltransferase